jgi:uncharacterized protein YhjY with autotransporter beta-barrel domain
MRTDACVLMLLSAALLANPAHAVDASDALVAKFNTVCAGAAPGSALAARCAVVLGSADPNARTNAADFNALEELPGQGRLSARDLAPDHAASKQTQHIDITPKLALFASVDAAKLARVSGGAEARFDARTVSLTAGLDWHPAARWQLGIALQRQNERQNFRDSDGRFDARSTGAIATASWQASDHIGLSAYAGGLRGSADTLRVVRFIDASTPVAERAHPDTRRVFAGFGIDGTIPHGAWEWRYAGGYDRTRSTTDAYVEQGGSGFDLIVPRRQVKTSRARFDLGIARTLSESWGVWQPQARIGWRHEFANPARTIGVHFVEDSAGTLVAFDSAAPDRNWAEAALGAAFTFTHGQSAFVELRHEFAHGPLRNDTLALGWRIEL